MGGGGEGGERGRLEGEKQAERTLYFPTNNAIIESEMTMSVAPPNPNRIMAM